MQRWILGAVGAVLLGVVGLCGAYLAYKNHKQNQPQPMWVPLPVRQDLPVAEQDKAARELKEKLCVESILLKVSQDMGLAGKWQLPSDKEAAAELGRRVFVRTGDAATPMGNVPAIHIGVNGKVKESQLSGQIAMRLMEDVWKILGIDPPRKNEI